MTSSKDVIFIYLISNLTISKEQLDRLIELLENQDFTIDIYIYNQLSGIVSNFFERKNMEKSQIERVLLLYLNYLNEIGEEYSKNKRYFIDHPNDVFSKLDLNDDFFDLIVKKTSKNSLRNQILASILSNKNLTEPQYREMIKIIDPVYFKADKFMDVVDRL